MNHRSQRAFIACWRMTLLALSGAASMAAQARGLLICGVISMRAVGG